MKELISKLNKKNDRELAKIYDAANHKTDAELILRDAIMYILENRNKDKFEKFLDDETSNKISKYFN